MIPSEIRDKLCFLIKAKPNQNDVMVVLENKGVNNFTQEIEINKQSTNLEKETSDILNLIKEIQYSKQNILDDYRWREYTQSFKGNGYDYFLNLSINKILSKLNELFTDKNDIKKIKILDILMDNILLKYKIMQIEDPTIAVFPYLRQSIGISPLHPSFINFINKIMKSSENESKLTTSDDPRHDRISFLRSLLDKNDLLFVRPALIDKYLDLIFFLIKDLDLKLISSEIATLPIFLNLVINDFPEAQQNEIIKTYIKYEEKYHIINNAIEVAKHKIDYQTFIFNHQYIICMLVSIMQEDAFPFLQKYMAGTVLSLDSFLNNLNMLPETMINLFQDFFKKNKMIIMSENGIRLWEEILFKAGIQLELTSKDKLKYDDQLKYYREFASLSPEEFNIKISEYFHNTVFGNLGLDSNQVKKEVVNSISSGLLTKLMGIRGKMEDDEDKQEDDEYKQASDVNVMLICDLAGTTFTKHHA